MTAFDWCVIVILLSSIVISLLRGFVKEILSLVFWVAAFVLSNAYGMQVAVWLPEMGSSAILRVIVAFILIFICVLLVGAVINMAISALIKAGGLTLIDRFLGGLFGLVRGIVLIVMIVILAGMTSLPTQPFWRNALLRPAVESIVLALKPWLPEAVAKRIVLTNF